MPDNAQQLSVPPESLERKHEVSEKRVRNVLIVGGSAIFLLLFGLVVSAALIHGLAQGRKMQNMKPLGLISAPDLKPLERFPKPNLQIDDDSSQRTKLYEEQTAKQNSYGWVDRSNGIVRIPIDRAIDLILKQSATNSETKESPVQLIQNIPDSK